MQRNFQPSSIVPKPLNLTRCGIINPTHERPFPFESAITFTNFIHSMQKGASLMKPKSKYSSNFEVQGKTNANSQLEITPAKLLSRTRVNLHSSLSHT